MPDLTFSSSITKIEEGSPVVRGKSIEDLIKNYTFSQAIFLVLNGKEPSEKQAAMMDAILVSSIDHGPAPASGFVPRVVASTGNTVNAALAAGVLSIGDHHGGAIENAMGTLMSMGTLSADDLVTQALERKERIPGFGHLVYKDYDPRSKALEEKAASLGLSSPHFEFAREIESELEKQKGKKLVLNVDAAIAALLLDLGFTDPKIGKGIFVISRTPGMLAHVLEELSLNDPVRRIPEDQIEHTSM